MPLDLEHLLAHLAFTPPIVLLAVAAIPPVVADDLPRLARAAVTGLLAAAFAAAVAAAGILATTGPVDRVILASPGPLPVNLGVFFDSLAALMVLLITGLGLVIARYSIRALDGEPGQGRFFRWLSFTVGAVLLVVVSRNLVMLTAAWMLTSLGLHQLLVQYPDRPWALWAARKKFLVSRLGDAFLVAAVALAFRCFGTSDFAAIFARIESPGAAGIGWEPGAIALLIALAAMTKSAQLPFHSWLPDTMEAPTPVSALMHAGVINAGGYLVIRLSPLVSLSPAALDALAIVGSATALCGGVVMLTQTSIKRALAFSTVAQMGFMMLQCGLGGFAAAALHIVAHSAYKAHAFLAAGGVLDAALRTRGAAAAPAPARAVAAVLAAAAAAGAICLGTLAAAGIDLAAKPGGIVLTMVLGIALTTLIWQSSLGGSAWLAGGGALAAMGVAAAAVTAWLGFEWLLAGSAIARAVPPASPLDAVVAGVVVLGFVGVFALQAATPLLSRLPFVRSLHVHAANGFYLDIPARRITARVWGLTDPVP